MNRKQRREYEKKYGQQYTMQKYRDDAIEEGVKRGIKASMDIILYMTAYTINYKLGLGKKRLPEIMEAIIDNIDAYRTGHLSVEDYREIKKQMNEKGFIM